MSTWSCAAEPESGAWGQAPPPPDLQRFLEGPQARRSELWRALGIFAEFIRGFRALHFVGPCVTVFGSARLKVDDPYCALARELGGGLARLGFTVMTGGGPGIMEAANRGAREAGGRSIGCNIQLPTEQRPNPGGFGTLDEIFETATLIQTRKIRDFPLVLVGRDFWRPLTDFLRGTLERRGLVDRDDIDRIIVTDSAADAVAAVGALAIPAFGLRDRPLRPRRLLRE